MKVLTNHRDAICNSCGTRAKVKAASVGDDVVCSFCFSADLVTREGKEFVPKWTKYTRCPGRRWNNRNERRLYPTVTLEK